MKLAFSYLENENGYENTSSGSVFFKTLLTGSGSFWCFMRTVRKQHFILECYYIPFEGGVFKLTIEFTGNIIETNWAP